MVKDFWFIVGAYSAIWILIGGYVLSLGSKLTELNKRIDALQAEREG